MESAFKYRAFISYSHRDESWARWLHRGLENYRVPRHLVGRETAHGPVPARLAPVFRDRDELATATNLGETLTRALAQSACQIVVCSPAAARSRWVREEILAFKRLGREQRIFSLIVSGEPGAAAHPATADEECFPPELILRIGRDGELTTEPTEPIAADVRPHKDGRQDALLKLIAGMLDVGFDDLKQREVHRRQRRLMALVTASIAGMTITSGLAVAAWLARNEAERERARAESEAETAKQTTRFMVDLFKVSDPSEALGNKITAREILDKGAARIDAELAAQPAIQATLMDTMGTVYTSLGLYSSAIPLAREALDKRRLLPERNEAAIAESLSHLGIALSRNADFPEAEQRLREALAMQRNVFGKDSAEVATTLSALADVMSFTGEYDKGEPVIAEALRIRRKLYGRAHPDVATSLGDLGVNFGERGDFKQANAYLREALAMQRELHGAVHPDLAEALNNLAWSMMGLNEPTFAEPLYQEALEMKRKMLGDAHPELAAGLNNLAFVLETKGDYRGAEQAYRESLAMNLKLLGPSHPEIALVMSNLAFVLDEKGDRRAAIRLQRQSLEMSRHELGSEHPDVAGGAANLAYWLISTGEYAEAERLLDESLAIRRKALGPEHPQVASTLTVRANLLVAEKRYAEARDVARDALRILAVHVPDEHWQVAMARNAEGAALTGLGQYAAAEKLLLASLPRLSGSPIPDLSRSGRLRLTELYTRWGKPDEARKYRDVSP